MGKLSCIVVLVMAIIMISCAKSETLTGIVEEVRITSVIKQGQEKSGDPVGGAIVGGLLFGTVGAIAGATLENSPSEIIVQRDIMAAMFIAKMDDGTRITLEFGQYDNDRIRCSLLRKGDKVKIRKVLFGGETPYYYWD